MSMRKHALHLITTGKQELELVSAIAESLPGAMIDAVHIREKHRPASEIIRWHHTLAPILPHTRLIIGDRVDAAIVCGAAGVQLGFTSIPVKDAAELLPDGMRIGASVHSVREAQDAAVAGADYVLYGHIFPTGSKEGVAPRGLEALADVVRSVDVPVIAIGGIDPDKVERTLSTGCAGIAVMSSVFTHQQPALQTVRFREAIDCCKHIPRRRFI